jgi:hypothetical protein
MFEKAKAAGSGVWLGGLELPIWPVHEETPASLLAEQGGSP